MKRLFTLAVMGVATLALACSGGNDSANQAAETETAAASQTDEAAMDDHAAADDHAGHDHAAPAEMLQTGSAIELTGNMGCGHCTYKVGTSCSAAVQTADGHIVILDNVPQESEMFQNRMDGAEVTVAGVVEYKDGVAHMTMESAPM